MSFGERKEGKTYHSLGLSDTGVIENKMPHRSPHHFENRRLHRAYPECPAGPEDDSRGSCLS